MNNRIRQHLAFLSLLLCAVLLFSSCGGVLPPAVTDAVTDPVTDGAPDDPAPAERTVEIGTAEQLLAAAAEINADPEAGRGVLYRLTADIDLNPGWTDTSRKLFGKLVKPEIPEVRFPDIDRFSGVLDGNGHTLSGVYFSGNAESKHGFALIRELAGGTVRDLTVRNAYVYCKTIDRSVGGLVGLSSGGLLENVTFLGNVYAASTGAAKLGGLVGSLTGGTLTVRNCVFGGTVALVGTDGTYPAANEKASVSELVADGGDLALVLSDCRADGNLFGGNSLSDPYCAAGTRQLSLSGCSRTIPADAGSSTRRVLLASDVHLAHAGDSGTDEVYGVTPADRLQRFIDDVKAEYTRDPFDALLLLGDYSLDFWKWQTKGTWLTQGLSNTKKFVDEYLSQLYSLPIDIRMIPGNHEQYGEELWEQLTGGYKRQDYYVCGDYLFLLLDTWAADLDPTEHSDGTYSGVVDMEFVNSTMARFPEKKVILCAHFLDVNNANEKKHTEFLNMLRSDDRIVCIFAGHNHRSEIRTLEEYNGLKEIFTGNYYQTGAATPMECMWGFREVILGDEEISTSYITPENTITYNGSTYRHPYGKQDSVTISVV